MHLPFLLLSLLAVPPAPPSGPAPRLGEGEPALVDTVSTLLADAALRDAQLSIAVETADGALLYALNPDLQLHPASNTKLFTTAAALARLGPTYTYETDLATTAMTDGVAADLYLIGRGDPGFVNESLWKLIEDARAAGLREVAGDLFVDDSFFTPEVLAPGFGSKDMDDPYRAASSAASFNYNTLVISLRPGASVGAPPVVQLGPDCGYADVENTATTVAKGKERLQVSARPRGEGMRVYVTGRIPVDNRGVQVRKRIEHPTRFTALATRYFLERAGIAVRGQVRTGKAPALTTRLARSLSQPLSELAADVNKLSNNFMAEQFVRTLGAVRRGTGDWASGVVEVRDFLNTEVGLRGFQYVNGSGLFGDTRFSARQLVGLLQAMWTRKPALPEFWASLAIGGADGTLHRRFRDLPALSVRGKTGTLDKVICTSGVTQLADGSPVFFSFLMNDLEGAPWKVWRVQDGIIAALTSYSRPARR